MSRASKKRASEQKGMTEQIKAGGQAEFIPNPQFAKYGKLMIVESSVFLHDPWCIPKFQDNIVDIPINTVTILDKLQRQQSGIGDNAKEACRALRNYMEKGQITNGVQTETGGLVIVDHNGKKGPKLEVDLDPKDEDRRTITMARELGLQYPNHKVVLITKDLSLMAKAQACHVTVQDFENDKHLSSIERLYTGFADVRLAEGQDDCFADLFGSGSVDIRKIAKSREVSHLLHNQCCRFTSGDGKMTALSIYKKEKGKFIWIDTRQRNQFSVFPRNDEQFCLNALLRDEDIRLITCTGIAGTGKTLFPLSGGYDQIISGHFNRMIIYRPMWELGKKEMGFLPGDIAAKFAEWMKPIYDNLGVITTNNQISGGSKLKKHRTPEVMLKKGEIEIGPFNYIRGRSIGKGLMFIDEAQNLTPHEVKTIITRAGEGLVVVLSGDLTQIDNPFLSPISSGLAYVIEKMKGQSVYGHISLVKGERSYLAELAAQLL